MPDKKKKYPYLICLILSIMLLAAAADLYARAGGAGGGSSSSSSSSSSHSSGSSGRSIDLGPVGNSIVGYCAGVIGLSMSVFSIWFVIVLLRSCTFGRSVPRRLSDVPGYSELCSVDTDFDADAFTQKVESAFLAVQTAWSDQNLSRVRRFISDGVYQRFNTQLKMMALLKETNKLSAVKILSADIVSISQEGMFDSIDVRFRAIMKDEFICELNHDLDETSSDSFVEYWSFIRKRGPGHKDIYTHDDCPNCGGRLPTNMGEACQCPYCKTFVNCGEYDWVLSEITQEQDYMLSKLIVKDPALSPMIETFSNAYPDFSVRSLEDKVSNGYLQIQTAFATRNPLLMIRFVSDEAFEKLRRRMPEKRIVFDRLFLNDVTTIGAWQEEGANIVAVAVKKSMKKAEILDSGAVRLIDSSMVTETEIVLLKRNRDGAAPKGSLYAHQCTACGAPVEDSTDLTCRYCGSVINDARFEWLIADILTEDEYDALLDARDPGRDRTGSGRIAMAAAARASAGLRASLGARKKSILIVMVVVLTVPLAFQILVGYSHKAAKSRETTREELLSALGRFYADNEFHTPLYAPYLRDHHIDIRRAQSDLGRLQVDSLASDIFDAATDRIVMDRRQKWGSDTGAIVTAEEGQAIDARIRADLAHLREGRLPELMTRDADLAIEAIAHPSHAADTVDVAKLHDEIILSLAGYYAHEGYKTRASVERLFRNHIDIRLYNDKLFHDIMVDGNFIGAILRAADSLTGNLGVPSRQEIQKRGQKVYADLSFINNLNADTLR